MTDTQINAQQMEELKKELAKKEEEAKAKGLPFNPQALLRRMAQGKHQYYDSAEYVLKNGWPQQQQQQQPAAYFNPADVHQEAAAQPKANRFAKQAAPAEEDDDE